MHSRYHLSLNTFIEIIFFVTVTENVKSWGVRKAYLVNHFLSYYYYNTVSGERENVISSFLRYLSVNVSDKKWVIAYVCDTVCVYYNLTCEKITIGD